MQVAPITAMNPIASELQKITALVVCTDEALFRRNRIYDKLERIGVKTKRVVRGSSAENVDVSTFDVIVFIEDGMQTAVRERVLAVGTRSGKPCVPITHQTSGHGWQRLEELVRTRGVMMGVAPLAPEPAVMPRRLSLTPPPPPESKPSYPESGVMPVAAKVAEEAEQLAALYCNEAEEARAALKQANERIRELEEEMRKNADGKTDWRAKFLEMRGRVGTLTNQLNEANAKLEGKPVEELPAGPMTLKMRRLQARVDELEAALAKRASAPVAPGFSRADARTKILSTFETDDPIARVALALLKVTDEQGQVRASKRTLAEELGMAATTVHRLVNRLVERGLLREREPAAGPVGSLYEFTIGREHDNKCEIAALTEQLRIANEKLAKASTASHPLNGSTERGRRIAEAWVDEIIDAKHGMTKFCEMLGITVGR